MNAERSRSKRRSLFLLLTMVPIVLSWGFLEFVATARERARRMKCLTQVKNIGLACHLYAIDFEDLRGRPFPPTCGLLFPDYVCSSEMFLCPSAGKGIPLKASTWRARLESGSYTRAMFGDTHTDYAYVSGLVADDPPGYVLFFDDEWNHYGDGVNVVYVGGLAERLDIKDLHERLARQEEELAAKGRKMKLLRPAWSSWPDPPAGWRPWYMRPGTWARAVAASVLAALVLVFIVQAVRRRRDAS